MTQAYIPDIATADVVTFVGEREMCDKCNDNKLDGYIFRVFAARSDNATTQERVWIYSIVICFQCFEKIYGSRLPTPPNMDIDVTGAKV